MSIDYRKAESGDVNAIVNLVKRAFFAVNIDMMIWGCSGIDRYLADLILAEELSDISVYVAADHNKIVAVAQLKRMPSARQLYLNYICTDVAYQRKNIGSNLLDHSIKVESDGFDTIVLDVFVKNTIAYNWYINFGFKPILIKEWFVAKVKNLDQGTGYISDLPQSNLCFAKYGFSQFTVSTKTKNYSVGLLGENYFRISDEEILYDPEAITTLYEYSKTRNILLITETTAERNATLDLINVASTVQMRIPISSIVAFARS